MNEQKILQLTEKYHSNAYIDDALIPYFTQEGKWIGDKIAWEYSTYVTALNRMKQAYLSQSRRMLLCREGTRLLTSFLWREPTSAYLPYVEVVGSVFVPARAVLSAPVLQTVGCHFFTHTNHAITLPRLTRVGGSFEAVQSYVLSAPCLRSVGGDCHVVGKSLPSIEEVGGGYSIRRVICFSAPNLQVVGGTLDLHKSSKVDLPVLRSVGRHLVASDQAKMIRIPALESVGGDFFASGAELISARSLRSVGGRIDSTSAPDFWRPSIACGGEWFMYPDDLDRWERRKRVRIFLKEATRPFIL